MPVAFKEWAVTVRALAEGEQLITLRKGGIRKEDRQFEIEHEQFFLYPTFDHQRHDLVRGVASSRVAPCAEEGVWAESEPTPRALIQDGGIAQPERVRIRPGRGYTPTTRSNDIRGSSTRCSPFYVWTPDYAVKRLRWKPGHPLRRIGCS